MAQVNKAPSALAANTSSENIVELTNSTAGFSTLSSALQAANLGSILTGDGPFTVFAPTDAAFSALPDGALATLLMPENRDLLVKLLYNHVGYGDVTSDQLSDGSFATFDGNIDVAVLPTGITVGGANVVQADVDASNGVIHAVDQVLLPAGFTSQLEARMDSAPATSASSPSSSSDSDSSRLSRITRLQETAIDRSAVPTPAAPAAPAVSPTPTASPAPAAPQPEPTAAEEPVRGLW